jgi:MFS family permease
MGFSTGEAQCLVAPPYAFAAIVMYGCGWLGDKRKIRGPIIVFNMILCLIGLPIMGFAKSPAVRYFGVFLTTAGANSNVPATMSYQANNIRGQWKRAFCSATLVGMGGVVFRTQDAPHYRPGIYACIATSCLSLVLVAVVSFISIRQNKRADRGEVELEWTEGDQKGFRYTI